MEEWKEYRLGDLINISSGFAYKGEFIGNGENYLLGMGCVSFRDTFLVSGIRPYSGDAPDRYLAYSGDIVLATRQQSDNLPILGMPAIIPKKYDGHKMIIGANLYKVQNNSDFSNEYIYWLMKSPAYVHHIKSCQTGTTVRMITKANIEDFTFLAPQKETRDKIAQFFWNIENKIELNRRINENLEQQAQALFKSWFVDNSNPNWNEITLSEIASFIGGYSYKGKELADSSNIAMATIKNFGRNGGFKADGFKDINPSAKLKEYHNVDLFDILVAHTDVTQNADIIGNAELLLTCGKYDSVIFSMDLVKVTPKKNFPYRFLLAAMLKNKYFKKHCLGYVNGTTVLHLDKKALPEFETKIPSASEAKWMNCVLASYYKRIAEILQENDRLINLRDTLLPKLMSGKLRFSEIETEDSSALKD